MKQVNQELRNISDRLELIHQNLSEDFERAVELIANCLNQDQVVQWANHGLVIAENTQQSSDAVIQYFTVSPSVVELMPFSYFMKWAECGVELSNTTPQLAASYFSSSPGTMGRLRSRHIETWKNLGNKLYKGTWKSTILACRFFELSPNLLMVLTIPELERFTGFIDGLASRSYDVASECLVLGNEIFPVVGEDKRSFIRLSQAVGDSSWRQVKGLFEAVVKAFPAVHVEQRSRLVRLIQTMHDSEVINLAEVITVCGQSLDKLPDEYHSTILGLAEELVIKVPIAVTDFFENSPWILDRVSINQLSQWFSQGIKILEDNKDGGLAYFKAESSKSLELIDSLSSSIEFSRIKDVMEMYCRALAGTDIKLSTSDELAEKNIGWVSNENPTTEGSTVYVPSQESRYLTKDENFLLYKVISTHQIAHIEFGSFRFKYDIPSTMFDDLRPSISLQVDSKLSSAQQHAGDEPKVWITDMQRFFDIFEQRHLALDIFTIVEDSRLDAVVADEYAGIKNGYLKIQKDSLVGRRDIKKLPVQEALVEFLVRISLGQRSLLEVPKKHKKEAMEIASLARKVSVSHAIVEDAAEATLRIYSIICSIDNNSLAEDEWDELEIPESEAEDIDVDEQQVLQDLLEKLEASTGNQDDYTPTQEVDYRGDFKPELTQMMTELRSQSKETGSGEDTGQLTQEMIEDMLKSSAELELDSEEADIEDASSRFADNMFKEAGVNSSQKPSETGQGSIAHIEESPNAINDDQPETFLYDEWDFRADDYKPNWCLVRQKTMPEGDPSYFVDTLNSYGPLATEIKRQFEMLLPEMFRKVRKLDDGEEIDIDDVIEAVVDIKTGASPSEKLYWKRNKVQRDVAVVFLLDTSASTAEAIEEAKSSSGEWDAPTDPVEYMVWLRTRRGQNLRNSYKRIIDVEKEAIVLLIHALEAIGDVYGIYGFSGYGRENVEFYTIKDINEKFSDRVQRRIDRVAPLHATRMGPAIRHATTKLDSHEARTKLLFLISDGRPQDRGYSREGVEKEYAVHDTRMALDEARDKNINAFCLTVDRSGHDYLKTMCADMGYEVLDDIHTLPNRLLYLYRRLTN